ncbi:MAG: TPR end-of-group domain-containing protein [Planctomycetota bacterium]|jgi:Flp pilus assembly protein TadD
MQIDPQSPWLQEIGEDFLESIHREALRLDPEDLEALDFLAHRLTRTGRHEEGLDLDRRLVSLMPDNAVAHYNLACSLALTGRNDESLESLARAVEHGYTDADHTVDDEDLAALREDSRFQLLLAAMRDCA